MAENEYDDEYEFSDLDTMDEKETVSSERLEKPHQGKNVMRNALVAIVLIAFAMLGYKFFAPFFSFKKPKDAVPPVTTTPPQQASPPVTVVQPQPAVVQAPPPTPVAQPSVDISQVTDKLSALEMNQQNMRAEISSINNQLSGISSNVNELSEKIASLNRTISALASKLDQQLSQIAILTKRAKPKPPTIRRTVVKHPVLPIYFIQAVIPGRAWLIAPNGSTLTVREGTHIVGYGVIKLIDPNQGRILTSSGRVIKFSQQDS